ncbi:MAG TPA: NAD(P)-dependent alcohol dehydrogenase [Jiangellaceae bacterium]|nr:NAD(P)-dependent alcohol dehydrogenase [Jiangellaceae bacterium]
MRAIVQDTYGPADVLELRDIDPPRFGDDEVLIRVHAAGVDPSVWHLMTGLPYLIRLAGYGLRRPRTTGLGGDVAGVVEAVGRKVSRFQPGDEVLGIGRGAFAEYARARADKLILKPASLTFEQAAVLAISGLTALHALRDVAGVGPGQTVLVIGASGGVGHYAVQLAEAYGAHVAGVCSTPKVDFVRSLGADHVIDYRRDDVADGKSRYDVVLDIGGSSSLARLRRALTPRGTLVVVGGEGGGHWVGTTYRSLQAPLLSPFVGQKLRPLMPNENHQDMSVLTQLIDAGKLMPAIDRTYPLAEAPKAIRYLEEGHARGKVVITLDPARHPHGLAHLHRRGR